MVLYASVEISDIASDRKITTIPLKNYKFKKSAQDNENEEKIETGKGKAGGGTKDIKKAYLNDILRTINSNKRYPAYEKRKQFQDSVTIVMTLKPDGQISSYRLIKKSKFPGFNNEARRIVESSVFQKFPQELDIDDLTIRFSIHFNLDG